MFKTINIFILKSKLLSSRQGCNFKLAFEAGLLSQENNNFCFLSFVGDSDKLVYQAFL